LPYGTDRYASAPRTLIQVTIVMTSPAHVRMHREDNANERAKKATPKAAAPWDKMSKSCMLTLCRYISDLGDVTTAANRAHEARLTAEIELEKLRYGG